MKPCLLLFGVLPALAVADPGPRGQTVPSDWVDPATGHRVIRLSGDEGGSSLYFHQNTYTPKGDKLVFNTRAGIAAVDLTKLGKGPVNAGGRGAGCPGHRHRLADPGRVLPQGRGAVRHEPRDEGHPQAGRHARVGGQRRRDARRRHSSPTPTPPRR